jgi:23S rRNA (cytidine1920-2'-O)/16S rRNA (cytidine1409-2'-O)-methyltransferase
VKPRRPLDVELVRRGLASDTEEADRLVASMRVYVNGAPTNSPQRLVAAADVLRVVERSRFVSRGGEKLDGALESLQVDVTGATVVDVGSSTGGFTDCLLQRGAGRVVAVDVGRGLLHERLVSDPRVEVVEGRDVRELQDDPSTSGMADLVVVDLSFISLQHLVDHLVRLLRPGGMLLCLVKPQFEATREEASRGEGVIRDESVRARVVGEVRAVLDASGMRVVSTVESSLPGRRGNREVFLLAERPEH